MIFVKVFLFLLFWIVGGALLGGALFHNKAHDPVLGLLFLAITFAAMLSGGLVVWTTWR